MTLQPSSVSLKQLLALYAIIPILVLAVWLDKGVLGGLLKQALPFRPEAWIWWIYLFGMPHVVASMNTLIDREYLSFYSWKLAYVVAACLALPYALGWLAGPHAIFVAFAAFIVYHTIAQQFGITIVATARKPDRLFAVWKWSAVGAALSLYAMLYTLPVPLVFVDDSPLRSMLTSAAQIMLVCHVVAGAMLTWLTRGNRLGVAHIVANTLLVSAEFYFFHQGYFAFVVILARIIHEFTAWHIYATHDSNRALAGAHNLLFRAFAFTRAPVYLLSIALAFAMGIALTYGLLRFDTAGLLVVSLSFIHYWMEGFLWKGGSIHRRNLAFRASALA